MAEFLVEVYVSEAEGPQVGWRTERARRAALAVARGGARVRCVRSIFVPEDETCLFLYEADSADAVRDAVNRAGLAYERIVDVLAERTPRVAWAPPSASLTRKETQ